MFMGSCFAEELERRYARYRLPCAPSPFGLIYNPLSMGHSLGHLLTGTLEGEPFYHMDLWRHYAFHSSRCVKGREDDPSTAQRHFQALLERGSRELGKTDYLILTLGTAWVYRLKENRLTVNNCHRRDNRLFERVLYSRIDGEEGTGTLGRSLDLWKEVNPGLKVILTLSPVRHLRDDGRENSLSKAILRCLCAELEENRDWIHYFPSYEIMMDELRDYRWYGDDMCHPSERAADYIISRFFSWCASDDLLNLLPEREKEFRRSQHRPLS